MEFSVFFLILQATLKFATHNPLAYKREIRGKNAVFLIFLCNAILSFLNPVPSSLSLFMEYP